MADMIKFFKGLEASLPTSGVNGALYITTDEGAIYLGTGTGMKRLGDFVQVANVASLPAKAHESCLYYCVAENILAKWNGAEWKQINKQPTAEELKGLLGLGAMAYKANVAEADLDSALAKKINDASAANHGHDNKGVLDGITAEKVAAWDASEKNAKDYADGLDGAMDTRVKAVEAAIGENGSVATQIKTAIEALDFTDTAVDGEYVSAVNEVDGKISVTRKALPDYSNTYDAKGAAATALDNAKAYADGLAANYDEKGAAAGVKTELEAEIAKKVDKVDGYSLVSDTEIERLASVDNYDDAWLGNHEAFKVESLEGPITTLTEAVANISDRAGKISTIAASYNNGGYELGPVMSATEGVANLNIKAKTEIDAIDGRVGTIDNISNSYNSGYGLGPVQSATEAIASLNITVKTEIDKKADAEETTNALNDKVDKVEGYSLVSDTEIARLADVDNYDDEEVRGLIGDNAKAIEDLEKYVGTIPAGATATDIVGYVQEKTAGIATEGAMTELGNRVTAVEGDVATIKGDYLKAADIADLETKENVKKVADDLAAYVESNDEALAGVKAIAEAARTEDEVNSQIDTKIAALNLSTTYEPIGAETRAKAYADGLITDANLAQYTTEQEVKEIVDGVIAGAVDGDTITGLANLVEYLNTHGTEAKEMGAAIDVLEGKVDGLEKAPSAGIKATDITAWNGEIGAKALAETKLDASTFTEYNNAHASDYTNKQIDDAIDADVKAAIDAEVLRANGAYDKKGDAAAAQAAAEATAAGALASARTEITTEIGTAISGEVSRADGKYEEKGVAQGIVDALKLAETYEPIGAETRAIAAAKTETEKQVGDLAKTLYTKDEVDALISQAHTWGSF